LSKKIKNKKMDDEYGTMTSNGDVYSISKFQLECGQILHDCRVVYKTYGILNREKNNCMIVCHALTGNASLDSWWGDMLGPGKVFDTDKFFIVCANVLGSCYGTTGPTSLNPSTAKPFGQSFPEVTVRDTVALHIDMVKNGLGIKFVQCVIGGSLGGMQALEWALQGGSQFVGSIIAMCCGVQHSPWQIGISETQRQAIYADPKWKDGNYIQSDPPLTGLSVARQIAMITYRSHQAYSEKFGREEIKDEVAGAGQARFFEVERYLRHQGVKFQKRFDPLSYVVLTRLMDSHDLGRGRGGIRTACNHLIQPVLIISVSSDILYPPSEQVELHRLLPRSEYHLVTSNSGHDGFLLDQDQIEPIAKKFVSKYACSFELPGSNSNNKGLSQQHQQQQLHTSKNSNKIVNGKL
jgi:homoserine O-acetyltransferase